MEKSLRSQKKKSKEKQAPFILKGERRKRGLGEGRDVPIASRGGGEGLCTGEGGLPFLEGEKGVFFVFYGGVRG